MYVWVGELEAEGMSENRQQHMMIDLSILSISSDMPSSPFGRKPVY